MKIKLYIKIHNKTGLQYFGKTKNSLEKYHGSGKYWSRYLKKHGNDVTTICVGEFEENDPMLIEFSLGFSASNDIVNSEKWANLKPENGLDGGFALSKEEASKYGKMGSLELKRLYPSGTMYGKHHSLESKKLMKLNRSDNCFSSDSYHTQESKDLMKESHKVNGHQKGSKNSQAGTKLIHNPKTRENKRICGSELDDFLGNGWCTGFFQEVLECPHCGVSGSKPNMVRWHFENCKTNQTKGLDMVSTRSPSKCKNK